MIIYPDGKRGVLNWCRISLAQTAPVAHPSEISCWMWSGCDSTIPNDFAHFYGWNHMAGLWHCFTNIARIWDHRMEGCEKKWGGWDKNCFFYWEHLRNLWGWLWPTPEALWSAKQKWSTKNLGRTYVVYLPLTKNIRPNWMIYWFNISGWWLTYPSEKW